MEKKARTYSEMPATYEYKGHTYHLGRDFDSAGWRSLETGNEMFRYYYGPNDDRMFLWVDCYLNPIEDFFNYDQFLPKA